MCKEILKVLWWYLKWYLKLNVLYWAFIGLAEIPLKLRLIEELKPDITYSQKVKLVNIYIFEKAKNNWKNMIGLNDEAETKPGESEEKKESEA